MQLRTYPIEALRRRAEQPRKHFDDAKLDELAASIRENGLLEPIVVRPRDDMTADIIAGERRWIACQRAGMKDVPCVLREVGDGDEGEAELKVLSLIENVQRADLGPMEKAEALRVMMDAHGWNQTEVGERVGRSNAWVNKHLVLLSLPEDVQRLLREGRITLRQGLAIRQANGHASDVARRAVEEGLSGRALERAVKQAKRRSRRRSKKTVQEADLEHRIRAKLGVRAEVKWGAKKGTITLYVPDLDVLDGVIETLGI